MEGEQGTHSLHWVSVGGGQWSTLTCHLLLGWELDGLLEGGPVESGGLGD